MSGAQNPTVEAVVEAEKVEPSYVAGHPVLDFVNTVAWRADESRRVDRVADAAEWARWAARAGLSASSLPDETTLRGLREALAVVLDALVDGTAPPSGAWDMLRDAFLAAREAAELPPAFPLRPVPATVSGELALLAEELLGDARELSCLHRCAGPGCGWFFLDRTRNGARRWCSSGDCGNRDRARRHYARTRKAAQ
ncbi:CGNR zinc finger domain-containing protein [Actinospica robiniae]|uniref:CGNR zinc finger domain-containing protein n=1 Tax=Actinospica robiniae TaxID=304901 RepID=UPI000401AE8F|nr:CGNR zinc finger domain-containing protein [Actinospica robiniae]